MTGNSGYVYFVWDGEAIKIGFAMEPIKRLAGLRSSRSSELKMLGAIAAHRHMEKMLHHRFVHLKIRGEWFQPGEDLLDMIEDLNSDGRLVGYKELYRDHRIARMRRTYQKHLQFLGQDHTANDDD